MPVHNTEIAEIFNRVADFLDLENSNPFRIRAYRNAARTISGLSRNVVDMINQDEDLTQLPGIGHDLYHFKLTKEQQTKRILRAMDNPYFNIFAHPTGRRIGKREPYEIDLQQVMAAAKPNGCFLELNAQPERLDLSDIYVKMAKDVGVKLAISTDAHSISDLDFMRFGIGQARRGWLEADDVINTRSWKELQKVLHRN